MLFSTLNNMSNPVKIVLSIHIQNIKSVSSLCFMPSIVADFFNIEEMNQ